MASIEIFCCYARTDQSLLNALKRHLFPLERQGLITLWNDTDISPGANWEKEIEKHLNSAQIILLLVSPDFIASEYCYSKEMLRAMERHEAGEAHVVPIILRPVLWENTPFGQLQALPTDAKPLSGHTWHNLDEALFDVAKGIRNVVQGFLQEQQKPLMQEQPSLDLSTYFEAKAIPTGFEDLDHLIGGLQRSDLVIIGAPPSTGKTSFALSIALNVAIKHAHPLGIISLEMNKERLEQRLIFMEAEVDQQHLRMGRIKDEEWERLVYAIGSLSDASICIYDSAHLTISQLRKQAQELVNEGNVDLIIVDYVDLIQAEAIQKQYENERQDFREISRCLKVLARELNVPIVALIQLPRIQGTRQSKVPRLSDIDAAFENDADIVMFIYRDDMYNPETERMNIADIIVAKHRNGPLGQVSLYFFPRTGRFRDLIRYPPDDRPV